MAHSAVPPHVYDLLIVGAGPVGLLTALGAHSRGCRNIAVIDQTRAFRRAGENLDLQPNGMRALRLVAPSVADAVRAQALPSSVDPFPLFDVDGTLVDEVLNTGVGGETKASVLWSNLQKALLDAMPADVNVDVNLQLLDLRYNAVKGVGDEEEEVVRADCLQSRMRENPFVNWGNDPAAVGANCDGPADGDVPQTKELFAKIVIGADGINSVCRSVVYRNTGGEAWERVAKAEYTGFMSFKGKGFLGEVESSVGVEFDSFMQGRTYAMVGCRKQEHSLGAPDTMVARVRKDIIGKMGFEWLFLMHLAVAESIAQRDADAGGHGALYSSALTALSDVDYPECLLRLARALLTEEDEKHSIVTRPLYVVPVDHPAPFERLPTVGETPDFPEGFYRPFGHGRIILVGDALHGGPPTIAQGTSMGFEDCCELVDLLAKSHSWASGINSHTRREAVRDVLGKYRSARIERLSLVQRLTMKGTLSAEDRAIMRQEITTFVPAADGW